MSLLDGVCTLIQYFFFSIINVAPDIPTVETCVSLKQMKQTNIPDLKKNRLVQMFNSHCQQTGLSYRLLIIYKLLSLSEQDQMYYQTLNVDIQILIQLFPFNQRLYSQCAFSCNSQQWCGLSSKILDCNILPAKCKYSRIRLVLPKIDTPSIVSPMNQSRFSTSSDQEEVWSHSQNLVTILSLNLSVIIWLKI